MDQYKFKAWDGEKMWEYAVPLLSQAHNGGTINVSDNANGSFNKFINGKLLQFTGLLDKNNKEIYEGFIVKGISREPRKQYIGKIIFDSIYGSFVVVGYDNEFKYHKFELAMPLGECRFNIEVIGNIHEHSYLLEKDGNG